MHDSIPVWLGLPSAVVLTVTWLVLEFRSAPVVDPDVSRLDEWDSPAG